MFQLAYIAIIQCKTDSTGNIVTVSDSDLLIVLYLGVILLALFVVEACLPNLSNFSTFVVLLNVCKRQAEL